MTTRFTSIENELQSLVKGDVWFDDETRETYSTAMCMYKIMPVGVVAPKDTDDVQNVVRFCKENHIAVIPRGGGTGLAGQAVGLGIVLDFAKHMNHVVKISDEGDSVTVQAGCILSDVNTLLQPLGKYYPIDPQSAKLCTVGGTIATNAAGAHGLRFGATKDQVARLSLVLSNGDQAEIFPQESFNILSDEGKNIFSNTKNILQSHRSLIEQKKPRVAKTSSGYNVYESLRDGNLDAVRLLCGSEGTLAVVTEAELRLHPLPATHAAAIAYFPTYEATAEATQIAREFSPAAIELLDKSYTDVGKGMSETIDRFVDGEFQTMLLIEFEGELKEELLFSAEALHSVLQQHGLLSRWILLAAEQERSEAWRLREEVSVKLNTLLSEFYKISAIEDGIVPLENLPAYMKGLKRILDSHSIPFSLYGHAGSGNVHCSIFVKLETEEGRTKLETATREVFDLITQLDGSLSGEHGDGFVRTPFLKRTFGGEMYSLFEGIKRCFDPHNIFNPQKIIGTQDGLFLHDIKYS
ncbi:MAG: FAD-binding oxidoreductase [Bacteroidota bacterium]|nr:FAD-binding oxidoreductase [Bacteroidota bacterium]